MRRGCGRGDAGWDDSVKHILLLGVGPLPFYETNHLYGFGIRAWQFVLPLLAAGHRVTLVTCEFGIPRESDLQKLSFRHSPSAFGEVEHICLPEPNPRNTNMILTRIEEIVRTHLPHAIVAAGSTIVTNLAASIKTDLPLWIDMFGDLFAEVQAKTPFLNEDDQFQYFHQVLARVLLRGDRFSVVSEMQKGAAVGQLGLLGRLNRFTVGEELVWTIPCAMNGEVAPVRQRPILRSVKLSEADFLLLCSGGFNTWTDVDTLFYGVEGAMEKNRRVHCVVTGGKIQGHHEDGYKRFLTLISKSPFESRFHLLGWVSNDEVAQVTLECNLGLNVDLPIYESLLGSRNRILSWMQSGLPVLSTINTELSRIVHDHGLGLGVPVGDAKRISQAILEAASEPNRLQTIAQQARRFAYTHFTFAETAKPLVRWADDPHKAGDNQERINRNDQPFTDVDRMFYAWAFGSLDSYVRLNLPIPPKPVIRTRPHGKSWWSRLWGR